MNKIAKVVCIITLSVVGLYIINGHAQDTQNIYSKLEQKYASKMAHCWDEVEGNGGSCYLEFIYQDGGQTPVGAKVIKK